MSKDILVVSYYSNMPGACQAEWIDDRIFAFVDLDFNISLVSSTCCFEHNSRKIIDHIRVPSLSPNGCNYEYEEIRQRSIPVNKKSLIYFFLKFMSRLGGWLERLKLKTGEGRWSWFITSTLAIIWNRTYKNKAFIYTTGGPASAHLAGIFVAKLFGKKVICEFQDPLSGKDIGRNKLSQIGLRLFESLIIKYADVIVYCTKNAMLESKQKYKKFSSKIFYIYPGANKFNDILLNSKKHSKNISNQQKINITYLGSLYQTRNLDSLMKAIDELEIDGPFVLPVIEINLYGNINKDIKQRILNFRHKLINIHGLIDRNEAMNKALNADVLLLIQNTDERSILTIPFKTYDYLHSGKLILGLIYKNDELEEMLLKHGHIVCQANNTIEIKHNLISIVNNYKKQQNTIKISNYTPAFAVNEMLKLIYYNGSI